MGLKDIQCINVLKVWSMCIHLSKKTKKAKKKMKACQQRQLSDPFLAHHILSFNI